MYMKSAEWFRRVIIHTNQLQIFIDMYSPKEKVCVILHFFKTFKVEMSMTDTNVVRQKASSYTK